MLGIDITLRQLETDHLYDQPSDLRLSTVAVEFLDLQVAYISINNPTAAHTPPSSEHSSAQNVLFGRGSFAIIEHSAHVIKSIIESTASLTVSLLDRSGEFPLSEYATGTVRNISLRECSGNCAERSGNTNYSGKHRDEASSGKKKESDNSKAYVYNTNNSSSCNKENTKNINEDNINNLDECPDSVNINHIDENDILFEQKIKVFGASSILVFYPEIKVDLVHSVGVGSRAGKRFFKFFSCNSSSFSTLFLNPPLFHLIFLQIFLESFEIDFGVANLMSFLFCSVLFCPFHFFFLTLSSPPPPLRAPNFLLHDRARYIINSRN